MKLLKPSWVTHDGHPIFSVDIHPDGSRFATGGQGADAGQICIWNMSPVTREADELNEMVPKLLCQMDNHLACVNCVRWSSSGRFLASGGDDKVIMIWQITRYGGGSGTFGGTGKIANVEHWKCVSTLRGHSGDVLDLAWSPCDVWLASCSVDNTVVVWNAKQWQAIVAVLKGHTGLVKGVSWDPVGKYIASQSDDKSLRVWRTHDWQQECMVTEPFAECGGTTHILRLCWSPDGQYLVSAHAMNNSGPTAQIIERDGWKTTKDFVGHRKAVTCVRFNPHILAKACKESGKVKNFCCCAIGSRDRSLSVWMTCLKRPLVVVHDLFSNSVLDMSWNQSGNQILVCSWDGTVAYIEFSEDEIGKPISQDDRIAWHQKLYGKSLAAMAQSNHQRNLASSLLIEDPDVLKAQEEQQKLQQQQQQSQQTNLNREVNGVATSSQPPHTIVHTSSRDSNSRHSFHLKGPTDKQIETRMPDGRRRITPLYIPPDPDTGDVPMPFNSQALPNFSSSTESKSRIVIEKRTETSDTPSVATVTTSVAAERPQEKTPLPKEVQSTNVQNQEKDTSGQHPAPVASSSAIVQESKVEKPPPQKQTVPSTEPQQLASPAATKRKTTDTTSLGRPPEKKRGRPPLSHSLQQAKAEKATAEKDVAAPTVQASPAGPAQPQVLFPPLKQVMPSAVKVGTEESGGVRSIQLHVDIPVPGSRTVSKVRCSTEETVFWEHLVSGRGAALSANRHFACVVCEDRTLTVLSNTTGSRLLPPLVLPSAAAHMNCKGNCVLVVTTTGSLHVWKLDELVCTVRDESVGLLFKDTPGATIKTSSVTDQGLPLLTLSTGKTYLYSKDLSSWLQITSPDDAIVQCSDHYASMPSMDVFNGSSLPLGSLQHSVFKGPKAAKSVFHTGPSLQQAGTLSFLDAQISASLQLRSSREYKFWLLTLAKYLATEGIEGRLKELCSQLLGPVGTLCHTWKQYVLGLDKRELLREILPTVATNLRLQRLFSEFKDQLDMVSKALPPNG